MNGRGLIQDTRSSDFGPDYQASSEVHLSIAIPTFNRAADLQTTLNRIVPQLSEDVECVVLDNASTDDSPRIIAASVAQSKFLRVIRHVHNIGGNANFLRCFEVTRGQWLWILPDDDLPDKSAVNKVRQILSLHPDAGYINFVTSLLEVLKIRRETTQVSYGLCEFLTTLDSFSHLLFLTAGVYRRDLMLPTLPIASRMSHTYAPHLAALLVAMTSEDRFLYVQSHVEIAKWGRPPEWSNEELTNGIYDLLLLLPSLTSRRQFCRLIEKDLPPYPRRRGWASDLIMAASEEDANTLRRAFARYSTIAAATGRYRTAAVAGILMDAGTVFGTRRLCRLLRLCRDRIRGASDLERRNHGDDVARAAARKM